MVRNNTDLIKIAVRQLRQEYNWILQQKKINLRPITIAVFDSKKFWGEYNPTTRIISISEKLIMEHSWQKVVGVLQHEIAHQLTHEIFSSSDSLAHGEEFKKACQILGVPHPYRRASIDLQSVTAEPEDDEQSNRIIDRVKKLLSLATSSNENEAFLAMKKVRELYAKYNLDINIDDSSTEYHHKVFSFGKKKVALWKKRIITVLVDHFFVEAFILSQFNIKARQTEQCVELVGLKENVEMAEYVLQFLITQAEALAKNSKVKGRSKSSYLFGIIDGFDHRLKGEQSESEDSEKTVSRAIQKFKGDKHLKAYLKQIYPSLRMGSRSSYGIDQNSFIKGQAAGKKLQLHKAIHSKNARLSGLLN